MNEYDPHSFIQIIDQTQENAYYYRFKTSDFHYQNNTISICDNILSMYKLKLITDSFDININIIPTLFLKKRLGGNYAMGYFKYFHLPTQHEIVFMNSKIEGTIKTKNKESKIYGNGYMEKDLGTRFPKRWLWIQANRFLKNNIALVISKADLIGSISGFFCFLNVDSKEYRFATYNFSKIKHYYKNDKIYITLKKSKYTLKIGLKWQSGYTIIAPVKNARMQKEIEESVNSNLTLSLYKNNKLILCDKSNNVSCEYLY